MKIIEREVAGYSQEQLANFCKSVCYPSSSENKFVRVRGICFSTGYESLRLAKEFIVNYSGMGLISLRMHTITAEAWQKFRHFLGGEQIQMANIGIVLNAIDLTVPGLEPIIAETINSFSIVNWYATAGDPQAIHPCLKSPFLVYLGLGQTGRMRYLAQDCHQLTIDKGSLKDGKEQDQPLT